MGILDCFGFSQQATMVAQRPKIYKTVLPLEFIFLASDGF
jgi:hypothetical protein